MLLLLALTALAAPADHGDRWLVIVHSSKTPGETPDLGALEVERLSSSQFDGLMPCFEILVAGSFGNRSAAVAKVEALKADGVDAYAKNAGPFVGEDPRVEAFCAGERVDAPAACPDGLRFVEQHAGGTYMHLGLDAVAAERALAGAPDPTPLDAEKTAWSALLPAENLGDYRVGQRIDAWDGIGRFGECTVAGFVSLTRGQPHFGWYEGDTSQPGCGTPEVFARLDCPEHDWSWAHPPGKRVEDALGLTLDEAMQAAALKALEPRLGELRAEADAHAAGQGKELSEHIRFRGHLLGQRHLVQVNVTHSTGPQWECGGADLHVRYGAVVELTEPPRVVVPLRPTESREWKLVDLGRDGTIDWFQTSWPASREVIGEDGSVVCAIRQDYCDCPC